MADERGQDKPSSLPSDFDTTAELWDRLVDDITRTGAPCLETMQRLVGESCQTDPAPLPDAVKPRQG